METVRCGHRAPSDISVLFTMVVETSIDKGVDIPIRVKVAPSRATTKEITE